MAWILCPDLPDTSQKTRIHQWFQSNFAVKAWTLLERWVRKLFSLLLLLLYFLKPLQKPLWWVGKDKWRKTGFCPCRTVAWGHTWGAQEPSLTHKQAIKLLSLSLLVIAELEGLILVLFLEDGFKSLHKPHHFTQDAVLGQVKLYKCQVPGTSNFLDPLPTQSPAPHSGNAVILVLSKAFCS